MECTFFTGSILTSSFRVCFQAATGPGKMSWGNARKENGGNYDSKFVNGVIAVCRILPIFLLVIVYWAVYSQVSVNQFV